LGSIPGSSPWAAEVVGFVRTLPDASHLYCIKYTDSICSLKLGIYIYIQSTLSSLIFEGHKIFFLIRESIELWSVEIKSLQSLRDCITFIGTKFVLFF